MEESININNQDAEDVSVGSLSHKQNLSPREKKFEKKHFKLFKDPTLKYAL